MPVFRIRKHPVLANVLALVSTASYLVRRKYEAMVVVNTSVMPLAELEIGAPHAPQGAQSV